MKICPQCASEFADDTKFCSHDATPLVFKAVPLTPQYMPDESTRVRVNVPLSAPVINPPVEEPTSVPPIIANDTEVKKNTPMIVGGLIAALFLFSIAGWFLYQKFQGNATTQQIEAALAQDDPFLPPNNLAQFYEAYLQANPSKEDLEATNKKIRAKIGKIGDDSFRSLNEDADPKVEWNTIAQTYQLLSKINPNDKEAQARAAFAQGKVNLNTKKYAEAADNFNKANRIKNNWDLALNSLGQTYKAQGKISDAFIAFDQATKTNPEFVWGWHNLFQIYRDQKKYDEAKNAISKAIELKPDRPSFIKALAGVQEAQGQIPDAITTYEKYIVLESNAEEKIKTQKYINDLKLKPSTALAGLPTSNEFDGLTLTDVRGQIDTQSIHFSLSVNGGKAAGVYTYDTGSSKLALRGIVTPEGKIKLVEKTPAGKETGKFEISRMLQEGKQVFYGEWQDAKGVKKLNFSLEPQ